MNGFDKIWNETMGCGACDVKPSEDCISREQAKKFLYEEIERLHDDGLYDCFSRIIDDMYNELPSVTLERPNPDVVEKMKKAIDEMTEIHSDGEFYIKNVDAKWIIGKYLYGAEMSGGEEDEDRKSL